MDTSRHLILINGEDKTDSIVSCQPHGNKCDVVYNNSTRTYSYNIEKCGVPLLRIRTNESDIEQRIVTKLETSLR